MKKNEGLADRVIRILAGIILLYLATALLKGTVAVILGVIGVILLVTGITGFCLLYKLLGISTLKQSG
ncbi:MAG: DUF2892 domain-containing protein [candidate division KSB1 bacterium]|nr:DUF2892 domain-containing protein [candidate division KSB1 bacterium]